MTVTYRHPDQHVTHHTTGGGAGTNTTSERTRHPDAHRRPRPESGRKRRPYMSTPATRTRAGLIITVLLTAGVVGACSSSGSANGAASPTAVTSSRPIAPTPALATASAGSLTITGGYIPAPASRDVAAAYLTITNHGDTADRLTKVTSSVTDSVMAMTETDSGGVGSMTDLANVTVPAHGSMQFVPNHAHLMLEHPQPLKAGDRVSMILTFTHTGSVRVTLPVIPLNQTPIPAPSQMTTSPAGGTTPMPGMSSMSAMSMPG